MNTSLQETFEQECEALEQRFNGPLRVIAKQAVTVWFNCDRLDKLLAEYVGVLPNCELLYAIDRDGRQVSSNIAMGSIDIGAYGQDLSRRPYAVGISALNASGPRAFVCRPYSSQISERSCVTVMHSVTSGSSLLGYVAMDIYPSIG